MTDEMLNLIQSSLIKGMLTGFAKVWYLFVIMAIIIFFRYIVPIIKKKRKNKKR